MAFQFIPSEKVEVPKLEFKPQVVVEPQKTALLIVDMQNDFVKKKGKLYVPAAQQTVLGIRELLRAARSAGSKIVYTQDTHYDGDREWSLWGEHCRADSWGWKMIDELQPAPGDLICRKSRYNGFYDTWLDHYLSRVWHVTDLIIVGTMSNVCVVQTAGSAALRWYRIIIPANGISANTAFDQALTLRQVSFLYAGDLVKSVEDIRFLSKQVNTSAQTTNHIFDKRKEAI